MENENKVCINKPIGDMYLAAALLAFGGSLIKIDRDDPKRQKFYFDSDGITTIFVVSGNAVLRVVSPTIEDIENYFISQKLIYPPNYPDALRRIKAAIHAG